ncbi:hypothetical protein Pyn_14353 [Prunus yedoensis var. nudiflora]|uniref:Uncharacterized protein n=1 Tax=Prunus yedoensis var. nudiflora TaxID=2094558 RepID=A0A314UPJ6_PRUYE|nr:hypothetical protein Pyn_14353 [Prunus yedoensis var. nudiflora]
MSFHRDDGTNGQKPPPRVPEAPVGDGVRVVAQWQPTTTNDNNTRGLLGKDDIKGYVVDS